MRKGFSVSLRGLVVGLGLLLTTATAGAQSGAPFDPTHYWTYRMLTQGFNGTQIFASDQFFRQGVTLTVMERMRLLNWVQKNNSAVTDTFLHYTWWNIREKLPVNRLVHVANQFGAYDVQVQNLEFLLAPAWKNQPQPGLPLANHYLCYRANGFPAPPLAYTLVDEWRVDKQNPQPLEYLCAPCLKQHHGQTFPAVDTLTHLAAYRITPTSDVFSPFVMDQFLERPESVRQTPIEYLFVPSEKTEIPTPAKRSTWGRIKHLYR